MKRATRRLLERMSSIYKILQETFQGIRVVKAFTMEPYERRRFRAATRDYYHKAMLVVNIDALADPIIELLGVAAVALALLAGSYLVLDQDDDTLFGTRTVRPAAGGREPAAAVRPAGGHRRPGAQAVQRVHAHPVRARPPPTASSPSSIASRRVHANSDGRRACRGTRRPSSSATSASPTSRAGPILTNIAPAHPRRRDGRPGRQERLRQDDAGRPAAALLRPRPRHHPDRRPRPPHASTCAACASRSAS